MDELTKEMHATLFFHEETDRKHRVWAAVDLVSTGWPETKVEAVLLLQTTMAEYERHKESCSWTG